MASHSRDRLRLPQCLGWDVPPIPVDNPRPTSKGPEVEFVEAATEPPKLGLGTEPLF